MVMNMAEISVIVPIFNMKNYLERCVNSILNQTFKSIEIILVDDGSTDNSSEICDRLSRRDSRIKVFHKKNGGLSDARNFGLKKSSSKLITFVDPDDWLEKDALGYLFELMKKYDADFVMGENRRVTKKTEINKEFYPREKLLNQEQFLRKFFKVGTQEDVQYAWAKLYKKRLFSNVNYPVGLTNEDVPTTFEIILNSNRIVYSNKIIYNYFFNKNSITTEKFSCKRLDLLKVWDLVVNSAISNCCDSWTIKNAKLNRYRANFGILTNLATSTLSLKEKFCFFNNHINIYTDFKKQYKELIDARIPLSRKFLMTCYYINYKFSLIMLHIINKVIEEF